MTTMRQVAEHAGVSISTVSHVINRTRYVSENVTERVHNAMEKLDYRPNDLARSLRRGQTNTLGLVLPDSANPYFAEIGRAIESAAFELGYSVILGNTHGDLDKEDLYVDVLRKKQVDGIIFVATGDKNTSVLNLLHRKFPVVLVDRDLSGVETDTVLIDNLQGGYLATKHLIDLGHGRIGCVSGPSNITPSAERVTGYRTALEESGIQFDEKLIIGGDFRPNSGYTATLALLGQGDAPTAVFTCNDLMAIGALRAAAEKQKIVPADLAVVGFDNIELASYTMPPLTTISQPIQEIGRTAAELLVERINEKASDPRRVLLSSKLIVRGSCGAK